MRPIALAGLLLLMACSSSEPREGAPSRTKEAADTAVFVGVAAKHGAVALLHPTPKNGHGPPPEEKLEFEPRPGFAWIHGHWKTNLSGEWEWVDGRYERDRPEGWGYARGRHYDPFKSSGVKWQWHAGKWIAPTSTHQFIPGRWVGEPGKRRWKHGRRVKRRPGWVYRRGRWAPGERPLRWIEGTWERKE